MKVKSLSDSDLDVHVSFLKIAHLWLPLSFSLYLLLRGWSPSLLLIFINVFIVYITVVFGHIIGLHRYFIHRSFTTSASMENIFLGLSVLCGFGGPLSWARFHALRDYWQSQKTAPHALSYQGGFVKDFFVTLQARLEPKSKAHLSMLPAGLLRDKRLLFLEKYWLIINIIVCLVLTFLFSIEAVIFLMAMRIGFGLFFHWLIVYAVHTCGYKNYHIKGVSEQGRNNLIIGWISFGEGFHNNHHKYPYSASAGIKRYEFDFAFQSLRLLEKMKLVKGIRLSPDHYYISKAKIYEGAKDPRGSRYF